jgi:hypothetical protein
VGSDGSVPLLNCTKTPFSPVDASVGEGAMVLVRLNDESCASGDALGEAVGVQGHGTVTVRVTRVSPEPDGEGLSPPGLGVPASGGGVSPPGGGVLAASGGGVSPPGGGVPAASGGGVSPSGGGVPAASGGGLSPDGVAGKPEEVGSGEALDGSPELGVGESTAGVGDASEPSANDEVADGSTAPDADGSVEPGEEGSAGFSPVGSLPPRSD